MDLVESFADDRLVAYCVHCAGGTETRDHCPSRMLLDKPYPENLPFLPSCTSCNRGFSLDEEYFACLVECARTGSVVGFQVSCAVVHESCAHCPLNLAPIRRRRPLVGLARPSHACFPPLQDRRHSPPIPLICADRRRVSGISCRISAGFRGQSAHLARNSTPFHTWEWRMSPGILHVAPKAAEEVPMPAQHGGGLHDQQGVLPAAAAAGQQHQQCPVGGGAVRTFDAALQDDKLVPQERILGDERGLTRATSVSMPATRDAAEGRVAARRRRWRACAAARPLSVMRCRR